MKINSKLTFRLSIFLLSLSAISLFLSHSGIALRLISFTFWLLVIATIQYIWEVKNDK